MNVLKYFFCISLCLIISSCIYNKKEYLEFVRSNTVANITLKTDGYYFSEEEYRDTYNDSLYIYIDIIFLYKDGTLKYSGSREPASNLPINERHKKFTDYIKIYSKQDTKYVNRWGHFKVDKDSLLFKYYWWGRASYGASYLYEGKGIVINDTSFVVTEIKHPQMLAPFSGPQLYKFRQYPFKPDSANPTHRF